MADEVSVRELRQNLSVHLRRVGEGRTLTVTSRGEPVALLAPLAGADPLARLVAEGTSSCRETQDRCRCRWRLCRPGRPLSEVVLALRDEDPR